MKNNTQNKQNYKKLILTFLTLILLLTSCGSYSYFEPEETIKNKIKEKYNISVSLDTLKDEYGMQMFQEGYFYTTATTEQGDNFYVSLGKSSGTLKDDYPKVLFDNQLQDRLNQCFYEFSNVFYEVHYQPTEDKYTEDMEEYLWNSDSEVEIRFSDVKRDEIHDIYQACLHLGKIPFTLNMEVDGEYYSFRSNQYGSLKSEEEILQQIYNP